MRKKILLAIAFSLGIWAYVLLMAVAPKKGVAAQLPPYTVVAEDGIFALFSPGGGCSAAIMAEIDRASFSVDVQAYTLTSQPIAQAIADAHARGVRVRVILDKSQRTEHFSTSAYLQNHQVPVYIDDQHGIAHNKVILIDGNVLITGSFNFTKASEERNAENLLIIRGHPRLMASYQANFEHHLGHSIPLSTAAKAEAAK